MNTARYSHRQARGALSASSAAQAFGADYLDAAACRAWLVSRLHPNGPACPSCGNGIVSAAQAVAWSQGRRLRCSCGRWFTAWSGTAMEGCKLDVRQVFMIAACLGLGIAMGEIARLADCSTETVRAWRGKLEPGE